MPQLGASAVDAVYLGGVAVDKLYLGGAQVYAAISPPDAPTNLAVTVEEDYAAPSQVTGLAVDSTGDGTIDLSWTAPASEAAISDYSVEYTPSGGSATTVLAGSATTSYQLTGLTNDTEYSVRVAAVSAGGTGAYSAAVTGTPSAAVLEPPTNLRVTGCNDGDATILWDASALAASYRVEVDGVNSGTTTNTSFFYGFNGTRQVVVVAIDAAGNEAASAQTSLTCNQAS